MSSPLSRAGSSSLGSLDGGGVGYSSPFLRLKAGGLDVPKGAKLGAAPTKAALRRMEMAAHTMPQDATGAAASSPSAAADRASQSSPADQEGLAGLLGQGGQGQREAAAGAARRAKRANNDAAADAEARLAAMEADFEAEALGRRRQWEAVAAAKVAARRLVKRDKAGASRQAIKTQAAALEQQMLARVRSAATVTAPLGAHDFGGGGDGGGVAGGGGGGGADGGGEGASSAASHEPARPVVDFSSFKAAHRHGGPNSSSPAYGSVLEDEMRRRIFAADLAYVAAHNKGRLAHGSGSREPLRCDGYADMTVSEYRASMTARPPFGDGSAPRPAPRAAVLAELAKLQSGHEREAAARAEARLVAHEAALLEESELRADAQAMAFKLEGVVSASRVELEEAQRVVRVRSEEAAAERAAAAALREEAAAAERRAEQTAAEIAEWGAKLAAAQARLRAFEEAPLTPKEAEADRHAHDATEAAAAAAWKLREAEEAVVVGVAAVVELRDQLAQQQRDAAATEQSRRAEAEAQRAAVERELEQARAECRQLDQRAKAAVADGEALQQQLDAKKGCAIM